MMNGYLYQRSAILGLCKVLVLAIGRLPSAQAAPLIFLVKRQDDNEQAEDAELWLYLVTAAILVLLGGAFAGLTIALMGQDEIYLQVIKTSGEGAERKHAANVLNLLNRGKHWVLVTLLLSNVITNETLPIVLDRSLGGGWPAVLGSTVLIVIFGEIAPQSVCVRYGLPIGSWMAPFVLVLMYILAPVAWPTAKLLDWLLGEDHGTVYKKAGLKTLVSLHKSLGETGQQLNTDEVTIISAVLDLKDKPIGSIMTPMDNVFTMSLDDVLDEETMDVLLSQGYSRIPIHHPDNDENFVGMLLVKMLITYDPEDAKPVRDFALATLPETRPDTSCLDIVNFFQEGKSHMVLVSEHPGDDHGALGVVTLEDVIEELIGEEIIDESDVFIDVHKAIRRLAPAPRTRIPRPQVAKGQIVTEAPATNGHEPDLIDINEDETLAPEDLQREKTLDGPTRPKTAVSALRRRSSATNSTSGDFKNTSRQPSEAMKEQLKHLGPSNLASRPKTTRYNTVKIKRGGMSGASPQSTASGLRRDMTRKVSATASDYQGGIGEGLIASGGKAASDGVQAIQAGYGSTAASPNEKRSPSASKGVQADPTDWMDYEEDRSRAKHRQEDESPRSSGSQSTVRSLRSSSHVATRLPARSGSITENVVEANGIRKVVLAPGSGSSSDEDEVKSSSQLEKHKSRASSESQSGNKPHGGIHLEAEDNDKNINPSATKKNTRRRRKQTPEEQPLLGDSQ